MFTTRELLKILGLTLVLFAVYMALVVLFLLYVATFPPILGLVVGSIGGLVSYLIATWIVTERD